MVNACINWKPFEGYFFNKAVIDDEEIVKVENIVATEEDFETELTKLAEAYGADLETVKKIFEGREKDRMMEDIAVQKALSFVADNAVEK